MAQGQTDTHANVFLRVWFWVFLPFKLTLESKRWFVHTAPYC